MSTQTIAKKINWKKIHKSASNFRVDISPSVLSTKRSQSFKFIKDDILSEANAYKEAFRYRDDRIILNRSTNTGYIATKVVREGTVIMVRYMTSINSIPYSKIVKLSKTVSYTKALDKILKYLCEVMDVDMPDTVNYDYGLSAAHGYGYLSHAGENEIVSSAMVVDATIVDPETNDIGIVLGSVDDVTVAATFTTGVKFRFIKNEVLYANQLESRLTDIESLIGVITSSESKLSNSDKHELMDKIERLDNKAEGIYRSVNNNESLPEKKVDVEQDIDTKRKAKKVLHIGGSLKALTIVTRNRRSF